MKWEVECSLSKEKLVRKKGLRTNSLKMIFGPLVVNKFSKGNKRTRIETRDTESNYISRMKERRS